MKGPRGAAFEPGAIPGNAADRSDLADARAILAGRVDGVHHMADYRIGQDAKAEIDARRAAYAGRLAEEDRERMRREKAERWKPWTAAEAIERARRSRAGLG